jgi:hypothetical protein
LLFLFLSTFDFWRVAEPTEQRYSKVTEISHRPQQGRLGSDLHRFSWEIGSLSESSRVHSLDALMVLVRHFSFLFFSRLLFANLTGEQTNERATSVRSQRMQTPQRNRRIVKVP